MRFQVPIAAHLATSATLLVTSHVIEWKDPSRGALGTMILIDPAASVVLTPLGTAGYSYLEWAALFRSKPLVVAICCAPLFQSAGDFLVGLAISLHGC